mgnify:CR=1 FL=1
MKSTVLASSRSDNRLQLKFVKDQELVRLMLKIFEKFHINWELFQERNEKTGNIKIISIKNLKDDIFYFEDEHLKIDLFIGYKKVIFILYSTEKLQQQILDEITINSKWKK